MKIFEIAQSQRQQNIINVIRHNDFNVGYDSKAKFDVLKNHTNDKLQPNFEAQLDILIASEENPDLREYLREYCNSSRKHNDFDEEKLVDDILNKQFNYI